MEIEQFIEQDIRAFLDRQEAQSPAHQSVQRRQRSTLMPEEFGLYTSLRDYQKEYDDAIKAGNLSLARKVLFDLKEEYDHFSADAPERPILKDLFDRLTTRFQLDSQQLTPIIKVALAEKETTQTGGRRAPEMLAPTDSSVSPLTSSSPSPSTYSLTKHPLSTLPPSSADISSPEHSSSIGSLTTSSPSVSHMRSSAKNLPQPRRISMRHHDAKEDAKALSDTFVSEAALLLREQLAKIRNLIVTKSYGEAMHAYRLLRSGISAATASLEPAERLALRADALSAYHAIKQAVAPLPRGHLLRRFHEHRTAAERSLTAGDLEEAIVQYRSLRALYEALPSNEQSRAKTAIEEIYAQIRAALPPARRRSTGHQYVSHHHASHQRNSLLEQEERRLRGLP